MFDTRSASVTTAPPAIGIRLSVDACTNASHASPGEIAAADVATVPASGVATSASRGFVQSCEAPLNVTDGPTYTIRDACDVVSAKPPGSGCCSGGTARPYRATG